MKKSSSSRVSFREKGASIAKRSVLAGMIAASLLSAGGCTEAYASVGDDIMNQPNLPAVVQPQEENFEQQWEEAKESSKKQIQEWYKSNVISDETVSRLWNFEFDKEYGCLMSYLVPNSENYMPNYSCKNANEIAILTRKYFSMLDNVDSSLFTSEDQIEEKITQLLKESGINITEKNGDFDITFDSFNRFGEEPNKEIYTITDGDLAYTMTNYNIYDEDVSYKSIYYMPELEPIEFQCDTLVCRTYCLVDGDLAPSISRDIIFMVGGYDNYYDNVVTKDNIPIETTRIEIDDILKNAYHLFADNVEYVNVCNERGISPEKDLNYYDLSTTLGRKLVKVPSYN